jgi:hypothetical protein
MGPSETHSGLQFAINTMLQEKIDRKYNKKEASFDYISNHKFSTNFIIGRRDRDSKKHSITTPLDIQSLTKKKMPDGSKNSW